MNFSQKRVFLLVFAMFLGFSSFAAITLPAIISSDMVLQRNTEVALWGWADAHEEVTIDLSWLDDNVMVTADSDGKWEAFIKTTNSKEKQTIRFESIQSNLVLDDILFGEIWLCAGQSNMEMPMKGFTGMPVAGSAQAIVNSRNSQLRLFTVGRNPKKTLQKNVIVSQPWAEASPETVSNFSAVAYYFGVQLQEVLDVPVGLVFSSWGGSTVQAWMRKEALDSIQAVDIEQMDLKRSPNRIPTTLYNGMLHPLIPFTIRGVIWYQGESNRNEPKAYEKMLPAMVADWRSSWAIGDFPFYFVQITPFSYVGDAPAIYNEVKNTAFIRESIERCVDLIPNSEIAITMDIGAENCIHPPYKKEVSDRLLYHALSQTYGLKGIKGRSPRYDTLEITDKGLVLHFSHNENGLYLCQPDNNFEVAGADHIFHPATAKILGLTKVLVSSSDVPRPLAVRYAWRNYAKGTLLDGGWLPVSSFRSDYWDDAARVIENEEL